MAPESPSRTAERIEHVEWQLDEAVDESFPASDSPATHQSDDPPANAPAKWRVARRQEQEGASG